jgi:hypothetical protein
MRTRRRTDLVSLGFIMAYNGGEEEVRSCKWEV